MLASCAEKEVLDVVSSPSGKYIARFYRVYGGGAAGYQFLRIDVRSRDEVFRYDDSHVFHMRHGYEVELKWTDDTHLVVGYPAKADVDKQETMKGDVSIEYRPRSDLSGVLLAPPAVETHSL